MALVKATNPSKRSLSQGIKYVSNPDKTDESLISGKDCDAQTALEEMKATKELYGKTDGRQYKHFIQSFKPDDPLDPSRAHQLGYELAQKAFPGYEVLVVTHTDKDHLHNHFIVNSVNFETGEKYRQSVNDLQEIKELSNRICEREGLHVMRKGDQTPGKALSMKEYQVAVKGESWKFKTMGDIDKSLEHSKSKEEFIKSMEDKGYKVKWTDTRKYITYTTPEGKEIRDNKLHDLKYSKETMENGFERIKENQLLQSQSGRSPNDQRDIGAEIIFGRSRSAEIPSERNVESGRTDSKQNGSRREDQAGFRDETLREREGQSRIEGESQQSIQGNESRDERPQGNEFSEAGVNLHIGERGNEKESGDIQQVRTADFRTCLPSGKDPESKLEGKDETVRSKSSDVSWNNSFSPGHVPGSDPFDEIIETLGDSIQKDKTEEVRKEQKTQTPKSHRQKDEQER